MKRRHTFAYLPFGAGPHRCIGYRMAMLESILVVVMIAKRFRLEPIGGSDSAPRAGLSLRPKRGMRMILRPRC
jgi:cytochrome P450